MLRGFYTAASGMMSQQRRQDVLSNNMANALTPGYKADQTSMRAFPELLIERTDSKQLPVNHSVNIPNNKLIGSLNTGVYMQETIPDFGQGDLRETGMSTDLALRNGQMPDENGSLFYTVQNQDGGTSYTRNGNFTIDADGYLVTNSGHYVLDDNGNQIQVNHDQFNVTSNGDIQVDGATIPLGIVYHQNPTEDFTKGENDLYNIDGDGAEPVNARGIGGVTFEVRQGMLERSNVDTAQTMTDMMQTYRNFEANQQVLKAYDKSMDLAVNQIGRLR
ncbi:flagellar basal-body rod protein FlgG [Salinibacillus kushneri]|uniref:Flagellar basal-body rod protein FlgG n=1 Tax=Salinibacillus kushneri TaxID=237682 RepID=A0A1I0D0G7_9BACI|nr:flagellar hook-basal body protein [Salinibacillus kushneri]SET25229.1 flagellar basal-body rod protein FlgG [Salinibacillus kushneri]